VISGEKNEEVGCEHMKSVQQENVKTNTKHKNQTKLPFHDTQKISMRCHNKQYYFAQFRYYTFS
jgi:formate-dependent nitrite reductase cytochrome c552 subunit